MGDEDKQFEASQQKLQKARKEGQVVKSKDFSTAIALIVMFSAIYALGPFIWNQISLLYAKLYEQIPNAHLEKIGYMYILTSTLIPTFLIILPILVLAGIMGIMGDLIQVGPLFTMTPLMPKPDKLNPTKYFKNLIRTFSSSSFNGPVKIPAAFWNIPAASSARSSCKPARGLPYGEPFSSMMIQSRKKSLFGKNSVPIICRNGPAHPPKMLPFVVPRPCINL